MAKTTRQTAIFGVEDWQKIYQTYREADFQSYDFETLRKSFVDYIRLYYPESFNDYIESSEFIALLDVMAFMGQSLSYRNDLNTRENFLDTAERRDSVVRLAELVGYTPKRNQEAQGYIKVDSVRTTENITDFNGFNLASVEINWNDTTNPNWLEQFNTIVNAALVDSQRIGRPGASADVNGIDTQEYTIELSDGFLPVVPFTQQVNGTDMSFEAVNASVQGTNYVYEPAPQPNSDFNILYRNDNLGFASAKTGFFLYFKQGSLQSNDFTLNERVSNRVVNINIEGINNNDVWLYSLDTNGVIDQEWTKVENIYAAAAEQLAPDERQFFSVSSRRNDQIDLVFGDGVFSEIPVGNFRTYVRASNGLRYVINPEDMQNVQVSLNYISRNGRQEVITFTCSLAEPVSNAANRENINDIKTRAPSRFYTQNRMVNGEDYTSFPYTLFSSIIKSKAVNRSSIGTSRYLDLVDITGKYSSTNLFGDDGALYEQNLIPSFTFTFADINDINNVIINQVEPAISERGMIEFYYANFNRPQLSNLELIWKQSTTTTNETTGYFEFSSNGEPAPVGSTTTDNKRYIVQGALVKFVPPSGQYFNRDNRLQTGSPSLPGDKTVIWASVTGLTLDGTNFGQGNLSDGTGPVTINDFVPTNAIPTEVVAKFVTDLSVTTEQSIKENIELYRDFGIGYDYTTASWYVITNANLDQSTTFSNNFAQDTSGNGLDNSWLVKFITDGSTYTVSSRSLQRFFASVLQIRFFFDSSDRVYDPKTGTVINDFINVLKVNNLPDSSSPLNYDIILDIIDQPAEPDGFVDDFRVRISYKDSDNDGVADDPDYFTTLVAPSTNPNNKLVFFEQTQDFDNLERFLPVAGGTVVTNYTTENAIELAKSEYADGQVFYATAEQKFYELTVTAAGLRTIAEVSTWTASTGRQDFKFQYRHNSPFSRRIDPGTTNIIDLYLVTDSYYTQYQNYINDSTGTVLEPNRPTISELTTAYSNLNNYKMISDNVILNSVTFKPLFGPKATPQLQATIKVIKRQNTTTSVSEIKSRVLGTMNDYFTIDKWDFGETFFFSELAAYLHEQLGDILETVVLVPADPLKTFGDLYEIRAQGNEIFVNAATVNDIEVINALTSSELRSTTSTGVN